MLSKEQAARRLIHSSIRLFATGADQVTNHLVIMATADVLREYAEAKGIPINQVTDVIVPEYQRTFIKTLKGGYYFLKHSKDDADEQFDDAGIREKNKALIQINCITFKT